jgi:hypothetical protein
MKTIKERAADLILEMRSNNSTPLGPIIERHLRALIEDAATIAHWQSLPLEHEVWKSKKARAHEKCAKIIEKRLRALAGSKEEVRALDPKWETEA